MPVTRANDLRIGVHDETGPSTLVAPAVQVRQPNSPDALVSFSDFLLERFGLVATMQVALIASIAAVRSATTPGKATSLTILGR